MGRRTINDVIKRGIRPEYAAWVHMRIRCTNENHPQWHNYGGRPGNPITVCPEWMNNFEQFLADMGKRPQGDGTRKGEYSLDRINNNSGYSKENCRWATRAEQSRNRSNNVYYTHNGESLLIHEWAMRVGMCAYTLAHRVRSGKSLAEALAMPARSAGRRTWTNRPYAPNARVTEDDVRAIRASNDTHQQLAEAYNVSPQTIYYIKSGRSWANVV